MLIQIIIRFRVQEASEVILGEASEIGEDRIIEGILMVIIPLEIQVMEIHGVEEWDSGVTKEEIGTIGSEAIPEVVVMVTEDFKEEIQMDQDPSIPVIQIMQL